MSAKTVERVTMQIGHELEMLRDNENGLGSKPADAPNLAVIEIDGGRILTRSMDQGPGVHEPAWRENKNATFVRMQTEEHEVDPRPELPKAFRDHQHVAEIAGFPVSDNPPEAELEPVSATSESSPDWRPKRLLRTVVSSMVSSNDFGSLAEAEAENRRFDEALKKAFLGDGLGYNWSIWRDFFPAYEPILDFVHVLEYIYPAAVTMKSDAEDAWRTYLMMATACWQS